MPEMENIVFEYDYYTPEQFRQYFYELKEEMETNNRIDARIRNAERKRKAAIERERRAYFQNQKLFGALYSFIVLVMTAIVGNICIAVLAVPGIAMMFTREMVLVNNYYREIKEIERKKGKDAYKSTVL